MICPICEGDGSHVNPAIDAQGLTAEDFEEGGPEFQEDYMSGAYDVRCKTCKGSGKILTEKWPEIEERLRDDAEDRYTRMMESGTYEPGWMDPRW